MPAPVPPAGTSPLAAAADWSSEHLAEPIALRDLADRTHLSERQLTRRFLQEFGRTPGDWLTRERLRRAQASTVS